MTLAIYLPCKDAHILISDRLEVGDDLVNHETDKILFPVTKDYVLVGSGRSELIERIYAEIRSNAEVTSENIDAKMDETFSKLGADWDSLVSNLSNEEKEFETAKFLIVTRKNGKIEAFYGSFSKARIVHPISNTVIFPIGVGVETTAMLARSKSYRNMSILDAIPFAVALLEEVASIHSLIGRLEEYGFSIVAFTDDGKVFFKREFRKKIATLEINVRTITPLDLSDFEMASLGDA